MSSLITDLDKLMAIMATAFEPKYGEAWTRKQVADALLIGNCEYFLISSEGTKTSEAEIAAGFYLSRTVISECELLLLAVAPPFRRQGLGKLLLEQLVTRARSRGSNRLFLEMRRGNTAEGLYRDFGFVTVGERPNYYRTDDGERLDAITFAMPI